MRVELIATAGITPPVLRNLLLLAGEDVSEDEIATWAPLERALAADYAAREHLRASDNSVRYRPRPSKILGPRDGLR